MEEVKLIQMKQAKLLHNPGAGDEEHTKEELIKLLETNGYECRYSSTKKNICKNIEEDVELLIIAGGDGTVRTIAEELLDRNFLEKNWPIALLPLGTANNIAKTLGIKGTPKEIVESWKDATVKKFDVGRVFDVPESKFFLESFGYGLFPYLMQEMKKDDLEKIEKPEDKLKAALKKLNELILSYEARACKLTVDGTDHSGKYLMAEIMNTQTIGPNLWLSPLGDPGDGELEVVLVPENHREKFASYVFHKMNGVDEAYQFHTLEGKNIQISWEGTHVHVDDEVVKIKKSAEIKIELRSGLLEFLVPKTKEEKAQKDSESEP